MEVVGVEYAINALELIWKYVFYEKLYIEEHLVRNYSGMGRMDIFLFLLFSLSFSLSLIG